MAIFYHSLRVGKNGKEFLMHKFQTLKDGSDKTPFAQQQGYTRFGKFLRKTKLDEFPQFWNVLKGDLALFGYRPEEKRTIDIIPIETRKILLSTKPGIIDLSSLYFFDEEKILSESKDIFKDYWTKIKPLKIFLQVFYIQNRCFLLNLAILWMVFKRVIISFFK